MVRYIHLLVPLRCCLGCTVYDGQIFPTSCPLVTSDVAAIPDSISTWFIGAQCPVELSGTQHGIFIPKLFPLLVRSRLAASQLYDPALGASEFVNAVLEQSSHMFAMDVGLSAITSLFECSET